MLKILIAVDGSEPATRAIESVAKMAHSSLDLQATLLCVNPHPFIFGDVNLVMIQHIEEDQRRHQNAILANATDHARSHGLKIDEPVRTFGVIADEIVRMAKELRVDQIAMGTRGMSAISNILLGSVAQRVLHLSSVPVLLVK